MKTPVIGKIYPLLYRTISEYSKNSGLSADEISKIVLFLAGRGFYAVNLSNRDQVIGFSMFCRELLEDYLYARFLAKELPVNILVHISFFHTAFSIRIRSQYKLPISRNDGIILMAFAVKNRFLEFEYHDNKKSNQKELRFLHHKEKLCSLAKSYLTLKRCFPEEPLHKTILLAI